MGRLNNQSRLDQSQQTGPSNQSEQSLLSEWSYYIAASQCLK